MVCLHHTHGVLPGHQRLAATNSSAASSASDRTFSSQALFSLNFFMQKVQKSYCTGWGPYQRLRFCRIRMDSVQYDWESQIGRMVVNIL